MIDPIGGILLLDKPVGLSSNAALQRVRKLAGGIKAGHTGSLDPLASGMLPICLGEATKLAGEMLSQRKCYEFGVVLGERSETGDAEGAIVERAAVPALTLSAIAQVLHGFEGEGRQVPPMYSAIKRAGKPLYRLARQGVTVEREPRAITIGSLTLLRQEPSRLDLRVECSKGTYVRVLAEDIARVLGTCGRLDRLRRLFVAPFADEPMTSFEQLQHCAGLQSTWPLLPADRAASHLPPLHLSQESARALVHGQRVAAGAPDAGNWRLYDPNGRFMGLGISGADGTLRVRRLFCAAQQ